MADMKNYVKFQRGNAAAYAALDVKNADTLYFISETNQTTGQKVGKLYLGDILVAGNITDDGSSVIDTLAELKDVNIGDTLADGVVLAYDSETLQWIPTDIDNLISVEIANFKGATETVAGVAGLVPAPVAGDQDKFLKADGTWATVVTEDKNTTYTLTGENIAATGTKLTFDSSDANVADVVINIDHYTKFETDTKISDSVKDFATKTELAEKANSTEVYTKEEVYTKSEVETEINEAIVAIDHLKRVVYNGNLKDLEADIANLSLNTIYMIASGLTSDDNKYYEYIVMEETGIEEGSIVRRIEKVGSWEVDLSAYAKTTDVNTELAKKVDKIEGYTLLSPDDQAKLNALVLGDEGGVEISGKVNASNVEELDTWITKNRDTVAGLYPVADSNKLGSVEEGAQKNLFDAVDAAQFAIATVGELKTLQLNSTVANDITTLKTEVGNLNDVINGYQTEDGQTIVGLNTKVGNLESSLKTVQDDIAELKAAMTWTDM